MAKSSTKILSVFDFDGTLTRHDSFVPFLHFAFGNFYFVHTMTKMILPTMHYLGKRITRDDLKQILIMTFLKDVTEEWVSDQANKFCQQYWHRLMRPEAIPGVANEIAAGAEVTLCSASPELVLKPFAERLGVKLIATQLEVIDKRLTGRIKGQNCRGMQKIKRLENVYGALTDYQFRAWGDSKGDHELLAAANEPHWRQFHHHHK